MLTAEQATSLTRQMHLTPRQLDLVDALLDGAVSNKDLVTRLRISENTVKLYLQILYNKTGERSRHGLLSLVIRTLLLSLPLPGQASPPAADRKTKILTPEENAHLQERLRLSPRQAQILECLLQGYVANSEIADCLGISEHTVKFYLHILYYKTDSSSRADLLSKAARILLVNP